MSPIKIVLIVYVAFNLLIFLAILGAMVIPYMYPPIKEDDTPELPILINSPTITGGTKKGQVWKCLHSEQTQWTQGRKYNCYEDGTLHNDIDYCVPISDKELTDNFKLL